MSSYGAEKVKQWRRNTKRRIVEAMGGKCVVCGYCKVDEALDLHHLNPSEKEFSLGAIRGNPKAWHKIVAELRKCVLICANCHREVEAGKSVIPDNPVRFNEQYTEYKTIHR